MLRALLLLLLSLPGCNGARSTSAQVLSHAAAERQKGKLTEARKEALASNFLSVADLFAVEMEHAVEAEQTREQSVAGGAAAPLLSPAHGSLQVAPEAASGSHHHKMATAGEDRMRSVRRMWRGNARQQTESSCIPCPAAVIAGHQTHVLQGTACHVDGHLGRPLL